MTDYVFETDLLVDGPRRAADHPVDRGDGSSGRRRPSRAAAGTRTWLDDEGAVRFSLPPVEPIVERHPGCTSVQRIRRELAVSGNPDILWRLIQGMDGTSTMAEILSRLPAPAACRGCTNGRRAGRHRRHRRFRTACRPVPPSGHEEGRPAGRGPGWRRRACGSRRTGTTARIRKRPGSPSANRFPIAFARFHALTRSRRSNRDYRGARREPARFRCAAPHGVRSHRSDAVGGT